MPAKIQQQLQPVNNLSGNKPQRKPKKQLETQTKNWVRHTNVQQQPINYEVNQSFIVF